MSSVFSSKFVRLLKTFTSEELKSFEMWLQSPWCNSNKNLIRLFHILKKYYPDFENEKLSKEKLFKKVLPNGKFSDRRMNNILSEGYLTLERFLVFQSFSKEDDFQKNIKIKEFQNRGLTNWFFNGAKNSINDLENKSVKKWEDHLNLLQFQRQIYHHPKKDPRSRLGSEIFTGMSSQIDLIYLLEKAVLINEMITRKRLLKDENHDIEKELTTWLMMSKRVEHPVIEFYKIRFSYSDDNMLEKFTELKNKFFKQYGLLNEKERKIHQISLSNDVIQLKRRGLASSKDVLDIYKFGFYSNILPIDGILTLATFISVVTMSNSCKDFEFTENFIEENTKFLPLENREEAQNWGEAHLAYRIGNLERSRELLIVNDFNNFLLKRISKLLSLQVYYDLYLQKPSYYDYLMDYSNSYEKWVRREKLFSELKRDGYLALIQKCRELIKFKSDLNPELSRLDNFLSDTKNIEARNWLLTKRDELLAISK